MGPLAAAIPIITAVGTAAAGVGTLVSAFGGMGGGGDKGPSMPDTSAGSAFSTREKLGLVSGPSTSLLKTGPAGLSDEEALTTKGKLLAGGYKAPKSTGSGGGTTQTLGSLG